MPESFWRLLVRPDWDENDRCVREAWAGLPLVLRPSEGLPDLPASGVLVRPLRKDRPRTGVPARGSRQVADGRQERRWLVSPCSTLLCHGVGLDWGP